MFKIEELRLINNEQTYSYRFTNGINYFQGKNDTGKTVFFNFLDFMFGADKNYANAPWFKGTLSKAILTFEYNNIRYELTRSIDGKSNYFRYCDEELGDSIDITEYKQRINSIFSVSKDYDATLYEFTHEHLTYRSFTIFNFLDEVNQGKINDFLTKCSNIKYAVHLTPILNYIFNNNIDRIIELTDLLNSLQTELRVLEKEKSSSDYLLSRINKNLKILNITENFVGNNQARIYELLEQAIYSNRVDNKKSKQEQSVSELRAILNSIEEQLKVYNNMKNDIAKIDIEMKNRIQLLQKLYQMIEENADYSYLVTPIIDLIEQLNKSISFQRLTIEDKTIAELDKQKSKIISRINDNTSRFKRYSLEDKEKALIFIESDLQEYQSSSDEDINKIKKQISEIKKEIRNLQNQDDTKKIKKVSKYITSLYSQGKNVSSFIKDDLKQNEFEITYIKKGNTLSPSILEKNNEKSKRVNYVIGSLARQTLIQVCGYLGLLKLILSEGTVPIIPLLVIDHISKPFDKENIKTLGIVLEKFVEDISFKNIQIFMFDDKEPSDLNFIPSNIEHLQNDDKTGFNPFFQGKMMQ